MNKIPVLVGLLFAFGVLVGGLYLFIKQRSPAPDTRSKVTTSQDNGVNVMGEAVENPKPASQSLKSLLLFSTNKQCLFKDPESGSSGIMYGGSQSVRVDFIQGGADSNLTSHLISDGASLYLWFEGENTGLKASVADIEKLSTRAAGISDKTVDINSEVEY